MIETESTQDATIRAFQASSSDRVMMLDGVLMDNGLAEAKNPILMASAALQGVVG